MSDRNPAVIGLHMQLGEQVMLLDLLETRAWNSRHKGLYVAPGIDQRTAENVVLCLAYIAVGQA